MYNFINVIGVWLVKPVSSVYLINEKLRSTLYDLHRDVSSRNNCAIPYILQATDMTSWDPVSVILISDRPIVNVYICQISNAERNRCLRRTIRIKATVKYTYTRRFGWIFSSQLTRQVLFGPAWFLWIFNTSKMN